METSLPSPKHFYSAKFATLGLTHSLICLYTSDTRLTIENFNEKIEITPLM